MTVKKLPRHGPRAHYYGRTRTVVVLLLLFTRVSLAPAIRIIVYDSAGGDLLDVMKSVGRPPCRAPFPRRRRHCIQYLYAPTTAGCGLRQVTLTPRRRIFIFFFRVSPRTCVFQLFLKRPCDRNFTEIVTFETVAV